MHNLTTGFVRLTATVAATGLVIASAGFGAAYAFTVGMSHGIVLAILTVLFAVALELVKPLAISGAFSAFASWSPIRGLLLLVLGLMAIAYSLTAELALMAGSRGDLASKREQVSDAARKAKERHQRARAELDSLKPARPMAELEGLILRLQGKGCGAEQGTGKWVCPAAATLHAELGRAKRRIELEGMLAQAETAIAITPAVSAADPGSTALATYLAALGIMVPVAVVAQWLALVPVLSLELGSALAMVLVSSLNPKAPLPQTMTQPAKPTKLALVPARSQSESRRERVASQIVGYLRQHGPTTASHRSLAQRLGADRNTVGRALHSLAGSGLVTMVATQRGTVLRLTG